MAKKKTATADLPDEAYEAIWEDLVVARGEQLFLRTCMDLIQMRSHEADYVRNGSAFLLGYTMAITDLAGRLYNKELDFGQDEDTVDYTGLESPF